MPFHYGPERPGCSAQTYQRREMLSVPELLHDLEYLRQIRPQVVLNDSAEIGNVLKERLPEPGLAAELDGVQDVRHDDFEKGYGLDTQRVEDEHNRLCKVDIGPKTDYVSQFRSAAAAPYNATYLHDHSMQVREGVVLEDPHQRLHGNGWVERVVARGHPTSGLELRYRHRCHGILLVHVQVRRLVVVRLPAGRVLDPAHRRLAVTRRGGGGGGVLLPEGFVGRARILREVAGALAPSLPRHYLLPEPVRVQRAQHAKRSQN